MSSSMPIENSLWHAKIEIFNLNRAYIEKEVPIFLFINCHFSILFFQFFLFYYQTIFSFKIARNCCF